MKCASLCRQVMCRSKREGKHKAAQQVLQVITKTSPCSYPIANPLLYTHAPVCSCRFVVQSHQHFKIFLLISVLYWKFLKYKCLFLCVCCRKCTRTSRAGAPSCACTPATWRRRKSSRCVPRQSLRRTPALLVQLVSPQFPPSCRSSSLPLLCV